MKILHIQNHFQPKLGYQEFFLVKAQMNLGHVVTVVTSDRYFPFEDYENTVEKVLGKRLRQQGRFNEEGISVIRLATKYEQGAMVRLNGLKELFVELMPDLVILHGITSNYRMINDVVKIRKLLMFKLVCDDHMLFTVEVGNVFYKRWLKKAFYTILTRTYWRKNINKYIGVADECTIYLKKRLNVPVKRLLTIPLASDISAFTYSSEQRLVLRKKLSISNDEVCLIYTGKLTYSKDPALILEAFTGLKLETKIKFLFIGNIADDYKDRFFKITNHFKNIIIHLPAQPNRDLSKYYSAADIAIWPREASTSMIDAAACKLPIIVCNYLTERLSNDNGIGIREGNIDDLASAIKILVEDKILREKMGQNGKDLVEKALNWDAVAKKFIEVAFHD